MERKVRQGGKFFPCRWQTDAGFYIWGQRHKRYLKEHKRLFYSNLLTSGKLNSYLADIDRQAEEMFSRLVKQMAECEGVTEQLKAENQLEWVGKMNNIRSRAVEIIDVELICV
ncbi:TnpV protein [Butyricicoccus porcorum]|uniref:TnpV protein n=1 Tax=Butyricicoccus porcorum TaxID=1945634 RepID=UPI003F4AEDC8